MHSQGDHVRSRAGHPRDPARLQERRHHSEGHILEMQRRQKAEGSPTHDERFWADLRKIPEALLYEGSEAGMGHSPQYAGYGNGGIIPDAAYGPGFVRGGNGNAFPRVLEHHVHGKQGTFQDDIQQHGMEAWFHPHRPSNQFALHEPEDPYHDLLVSDLRRHPNQITV
jgi:hypothetical protein